jgi:hypothetical protein
MSYNQAALTLGGSYTLSILKAELGSWLKVLVFGGL